MTSLSTPAPAPEPPGARTTYPFKRSFIRRGLKKKGILQLLTWGEAYTWLQVAWNGPVRASRVFGLKPRYRERCLAGLLRQGWIERAEDGYRIPASLTPGPGDEVSYVWLLPLKIKDITMQARVVLTLLDENIDHRTTCNRTWLAKSLGLHRATLHKYLRELKRGDLIRMIGRRIECCRRGGAWGERVMLDVFENRLLNTRAGEEEDAGDGSREPENHRPVDDTAPVPERHGNGPTTENHRSGDDTAPVPERHGTGPTTTLHRSPSDTRAPSGITRGSLGSPHPESGGVGDALPEVVSEEENWTVQVSKTLASLAYGVMKERGAKRTPSFRVLERDVLRLLAPHRHLQVPLIPYFLEELQKGLKACTRFMWKDMRDFFGQEVGVARRTAEERHRAVEALVLQDQRHAGLLVDALKKKDIYSVEALLLPDESGVPRLQDILRKNPHVRRSALSLDPVLAQAAARLRTHGEEPTAP